MRIGVLHDSYSPQDVKMVSGEDQIVDLEIRLLKEKGHDIIDLRTYSSGLRGKIQHLRTHSTGLSPQTASGIDALHADVIHCYNLNLRTGYHWLKDVKTPIVVSLHNFRTICPVATAWRDGNLCFECRDYGTINAITHRCGSFYGALGAFRKSIFDSKNSLLRIPSKLIATSSKMKRELSTVTDSGKIEVLGSVSRFKKRNTERKIGGGFVFLGRFSPEKGVLDLIQNWPSEYKLTLFGSGRLGDEWAAMAKSKGISIQNPNFSEDGAFLDTYEGLVFPSTWLEGSPLVIYEALSLGLPVICNDISSASEILQGTKAGVVISDFMSEDTIRDGINALRLDYSHRVADCYQLSAESLSSATWTEKLELILASVI